MIAYGLWYWAFDRGRARAAAWSRTLLRPTSSSRRWRTRSSPAPGWHPRLFDYIYVSFTNSIAFSPTDAMPLTRRAKDADALRVGVSAVSILLVAARAVNIFK